MSSWWTIPLRDGFQCTNLDDGETVFVSILQLSQSCIKTNADNIKRRANHLSVAHFPVGRDTGIFKVVDSLIAKQFNGGSRIFAALYSEGAQRDLKRVLESSESGNVILLAADWHSVAPIKVAA